MIFKAEILTPANTLPSAPVITRLGVYPGVTRRVFVGFPRGCCALAHMQIWHWGWQVWPWTPQTSFAWDDYTYTFEDRYPITEEPLELVIKTWNFDDTYPHTLSFAVTLDPEPPEGELDTLRETLQMLGLVREF